MLTTHAYHTWKHTYMLTTHGNTCLQGSPGSVGSPNTYHIICVRRMYGYMCTRIRVYGICMGICVRVYMCLCSSAHLVCVCACVCVCVCERVRVCAHMLVSICMGMCVRTYMCLCSGAYGTHTLLHLTSRSSTQSEASPCATTNP